MYAIALALLVAVAPPAPKDPAFVEGVRLLEDFEYEKAIFRFREALRDEGRPAEERAVVHAYLGMTLAELREDEAARAAFADGVRLDPNVAAPAEASPKVRQMLEDVRAQALASTVAAPAPPPRTSEPAGTAPAGVVEPPPGASEDGGGTLWLVSGGVLGAAGVAALAGAAGAGWLGYDLYQQGEAASFQSDAVTLRDQSVGAQIAAAVAGVSGAILVVGGATLLTLGLVE